MFNPTVMAALRASAQGNGDDDFLQSKLRAADAVGTSSAVSLAIDEKQQKLLDRAIEQGTVVKTFDGRFYLNERAVTDRKEGQGYMVLLILLMIASALASVVALAKRAGG